MGWESGLESVRGLVPQRETLFSEEVGRNVGQTKQQMLSVGARVRGGGHGVSRRAEVLPMAYSPRDGL